MHISVIGVVNISGGLTADEFRSISEHSLTAISPSTISLIPDSVMSVSITSQLLILRRSSKKRQPVKTPSLSIVRCKSTSHHYITQAHCCVKTACRCSVIHVRFQTNRSGQFPVWTIWDWEIKKWIKVVSFSSCCIVLTFYQIYVTTYHQFQLYSCAFSHQGIAVEQINELSMSQLNAITESQQRLMQADQLTAIAQNGGTQKTKRRDVIKKCHFFIVLSPIIYYNKLGLQLKTML